MTVIYATMSQWEINQKKGNSVAYNFKSHNPFQAKGNMQFLRSNWPFL